MHLDQLLAASPQSLAADRSIALEEAKQLHEEQVGGGKEGGSEGGREKGKRDGRTDGRREGGKERRRKRGREGG